jgi:hypothetical protein
MNLLSKENKSLNSFQDLKGNSNESPISNNIKLEKRRRHQAYISTDYLLGFLTYFDFFSRDTFQVIKNSIFFSQLFEKTSINSDLILFACLDEKFEFSTILKEYNLVQSSLIEMIIGSGNKTIKNSTFGNVWKAPFKESLTSEEKEILYSQEMIQLFEKTIDNALHRFKTPVVTPEVLFITLMEEKTSKAAKLIKKSLKNDASWYLLRYRLIKRLHSQEVLIRGEVTKNQHYFAYLMKTRFSEFDFNKLIKNDLLLTAVSFFRNSLIKDILKQNVFQLLKDEIFSSIKLISKRKYS